MKERYLLKNLLNKPNTSSETWLRKLNTMSLGKHKMLFLWKNVLFFKEGKRMSKCVLNTAPLKRNSWWYHFGLGAAFYGWFSYSGPNVGQAVLLHSCIIYLTVLGYWHCYGWSGWNVEILRNIGQLQGRTIRHDRILFTCIRITGNIGSS